MKQPILYIERMRDWNYGAFRTPRVSSCIAIGTTIEECAIAAVSVLRLREKNSNEKKKS